MSSKRSSQRIPKPIKFLDEIGHDVQQVSEIASKTARLQGEKRSLKAIKAEPVMGPTIGELISAPLPQYVPPSNVLLLPFQAQLPRQGPLSLFLSLLGEPSQIPLFLRVYTILIGQRTSLGPNRSLSTVSGVKSIQGSVSKAVGRNINSVMK